MATDYANTPEGQRRFENPDVYQKTLEFQKEMAANGVAWHNHFADECTIDFCCCKGDNRKELKGGNGKVYPATNYLHHIPSFRTAIKQSFEEYYEEIKHLDKDGKIKQHMDLFISQNY